MREMVVLVTTPYPRYPGDGPGSFMEPLAKGVAGHEVHLVARWPSPIPRGRGEDGVFLRFFRNAPTPGLNVLGYAFGPRADTDSRAAAWPWHRWPVDSRPGAWPPSGVTQLCTATASYPA